MSDRLAVPAYDKLCTYHGRQRGHPAVVSRASRRPDPTVQQCRLPAPVATLIRVLRLLPPLVLFCISFSVTANAVASSSPASTTVPENAALPRTQLRHIVIKTANVFAEAQTQRYLAPRLVNRTHRVTRESVIRREVWLQPGDYIDADAVAEIERNVRAQGIFADVNVYTKPVENDTGKSDLHIETTDSLSIVFSTGGSFLGGVGEVRFNVGEKNLFGLAHRLQLNYARDTRGELTGSLSYGNVQLGNTETYAALTAGRTEEGGFGALELQNYFQHLGDKSAWQLQMSSADTKIDYYENGASVVEVPRATRAIKSNWQYRRGDRRQRLRFGPVANWKDVEYGFPTGRDAAEVRQAEDYDEVFLGGFIARDTSKDFRTLQWFDTLTFKQDVAIGSSIELLAGLSTRRNASLGTQTNPEFFVNAKRSMAFSATELASIDVRSSLRIDDGNVDAWSVAATAHLYSTRFKRQTLASRIQFRTGVENTLLDLQQTLGEDNGLRGYPAREFTGAQSLVINLENRWRTPLQLYTFDIGMLAFVDAGWVGDRGELDGEPAVAAGVGLRIGSRALLANNLIRVDIAYPFRDDPTRDYQPTLSVAMGQVFGFPR